MTAKIEWYREVLELEPNSKVFFPLARLLAEDGQTEEAIALLQNGLERHQEFLEARLCLIELLFKNNMREACNLEVGKLSKMFAAYAGFWQAWAACLASDQEQEDTASIIRLLAAHFVSGPLKLSEVLNRGLDAMIKDGAAPAMNEQEVKTLVENTAKAGACAVQEMEENPDTAAGPAVAEFAANTEAMLEDLDSELADGDEPEAQAVEDLAAADAAMAQMEPEPVESAEDLAAMQGAVTKPELELSAEEPEADLLPVEEPAQPEAEPQPMEAFAAAVEEIASANPQDSELVEAQPESMTEPALETEAAELPEPEAEMLPDAEPVAESLSSGLPEEAQTEAEQAEDVHPADVSAEAPQVELPAEDPNLMEAQPEEALEDRKPDVGPLPAVEDLPPLDEEDPILSPEGWAEVEAAEAAAKAAREQAAMPDVAEELAITAEDPDAEMLPVEEPQAVVEPPFAEELEPEARELVNDAAAQVDDSVEALAEEDNSGEDLQPKVGEMDLEGFPEEPQPEVAHDAVAEAEAEMLADMDLPEMDAQEKVAEPQAVTEPAPVEPVVETAPKAKPARRPKVEPVMAEDDLGDEFGEEESFSLRTRSMAEVLAEQGDIQGALDIYQELAAAATSADEVEDISRRIATLSARLNMANASAGFTADDADAAARSKEKLIGMLEALAERVEARAQG